MDSDVTGQIQFRGYDATNGQFGTGKLTSHADKSITLYGNAVCRLATDVSANSSVKNRINFLTDPCGNNAAVAIIDTGSVQPNDYDDILADLSMAIPTINYVNNRAGLWAVADSAATSSATGGSVAGWITPKGQRYSKICLYSRRLCHRWST